MRAAPEALLDDGLLEVVVLESVSKGTFLTRILPRVFSGEHVKQPSVHTFRTAEVEVNCERAFAMYADGDPIGELPLRVRALKGAITMLMPPEGGEHRAFCGNRAPGELQAESDETQFSASTGRWANRGGC